MSSILFSIPVEWFEIRQRFHYFAETLAQRHALTVLAPRSHRRLAQEGKWFELLQPWSVSPLSPKGRILSVSTLPFYRKSSSLVRFQWRTQIARLTKAALAQQETYDILWIADPTQLALADVIRHRKLVYECVDDYAGFWSDLSLKAHIIALEGELARRADLVVTTSRSLKTRLATHNPNTVLVGNGTDIDYFASVAHAPESFALPDDLIPIKEPLVGFYGAIGDWVDLDLLKRTAKARPDWTFVLIGPCFVDTSDLMSLPNVRLLGPRPFSALRHYLAHIKVWTLPFKINEMTAAVDPLKIYEYLAAGRRVVSTYLPELEPLSAFLPLTRTFDQWMQALNEAVSRTLWTEAEYRTLITALSGKDWRHLVMELERQLEKTPERDA